MIAIGLFFEALMWSSSAPSEETIAFMASLLMLGLSVLLHVMIGNQLLKRAAA
jgi:hypothetical protein